MLLNFGHSRHFFFISREEEHAAIHKNMSHRKASNKYFRSLNVIQFLIS
jgi:hypothetical protein